MENKKSIFPQFKEIFSKVLRRHVYERHSPPCIPTILNIFRGVNASHKRPIFTNYNSDQLQLANMAASLDETENISDLVASRSASNTSLNGPRNLAYASVERANLLNLSKLCIKNLIESSLNLGRSLGEDRLPLQQFFVIIEHVLRHGLRGNVLFLLTSFSGGVEVVFCGVLLTIKQ